MNKEQLETLGLNEEQIKEVFRLNGIAVNNAKAELDTKIVEVETLQGQLKIANKEIEDFKDLDVEGIKKASQEYKKKYETAQLQAQEDLEKVKFDHEIESAIRDSKARNITAVKALLDINELKDSKNRTEDIKNALMKTKEENDFLFSDAAPTGTGGSLGNTGNKNNPSITKEDFDNMNYTDKVELYNKNIDLYKDLSK